MMSGKFLHLRRRPYISDVPLNDTPLPWRIADVDRAGTTVIESEIMVDGRIRPLAAFRHRSDAQYALMCMRIVSQIHEMLVDGPNSIGPRVANLMEMSGVGSYP
jgi:hypothetical protein